MGVPRVRQPGFVLLQESRLFELDFAVSTGLILYYVLICLTALQYIDFFFSCILLVLLYVGNKRLVFKSCKWREIRNYKANGS